MWVTCTYWNECILLQNFHIKILLLKLIVNPERSGISQELSKNFKDIVITVFDLNKWEDTHPNLFYICKM